MEIFTVESISLEQQIADNKELMRQYEIYRETKSVYDRLKKIKGSKQREKYRERNRSELALFMSAG